MTYDARIDGARGYEVALEAARADYLANRRDGETAKQYLARRKAEALRHLQLYSQFVEFGGALYYQPQQVHGHTVGNRAIASYPAAQRAVGNSEIGGERNLPALPVESAAGAGEEGAREGHGSSLLRAAGDIGNQPAHRGLVALLDQQINVPLRVIDAHQVQGDPGNPAGADSNGTGVAVRADLSARAVKRLIRAGNSPVGITAPHVDVAGGGADGGGFGDGHIGSPTQFWRGQSPVHVLKIGRRTVGVKGVFLP